jgi:hypothetical protein
VKGVPTRPPTPYVGPLTPGSYQGQTQSGNPVFLTIGSDRTFTGWLVVDDLPTDCGFYPGGDWFVDTTFSVGNDGTFDARRGWGQPSAGPSVVYERGQVVHWVGRIAGRFDTATSVSGTVVMNYELEQPWVHPAHLFCSSGPTTWSATLRLPQVAPVTPGSYQGQTENGNPVFLTVRSDRTLTGWLVVNDLPNN